MPPASPGYLGAMGDIYPRSMSGQGYATEVSAILAANPWPNPRRGAVPPEAQLVLDQFAAYGTCDQVRKQLKAWDHTADIVTILLLPGMSWHNIEATLLAAAPSIAPEIGPRNPPPRPAKPNGRGLLHRRQEGRHRARPERRRPWRQV